MSQVRNFRHRSRTDISRYGDYQKEPEEPEVGSSHYSPSIYNSWDPNWRGFIGTAFIVGLEEFASLISSEVTSLMLESLYNATVGDSYRVGGVDGDNLYPAYTNPVSATFRRWYLFTNDVPVNYARFRFWMDWASAERYQYDDRWREICATNC